MTLRERIYSFLWRFLCFWLDWEECTVKERILHDLSVALETLDTDEVVCISRRLLLTNIRVADVFEYALLDAMHTISARFDEGELFIPQLLVAADAFEQAVNILSARLADRELAEVSPGRVMVYTVEGDIHDIGKNIMASILRANGFLVHDLGRNIRAEQAVHEAMVWKPDVIIGFALMTTTFPAQKELVDLLQELGVRDDFQVLVGGSMASPEWAAKIGADGYAVSVSDAARLARRLAGKLHEKTA